MGLDQAGENQWIKLVRSDIECDSTDGNAWAYVWKYAVMRQDTAAESRALRALINSGFLTPS